MSLKQGGYGLPYILLVPAGRIRYPLGLRLASPGNVTGGATGKIIVAEGN